MSRELTDEQALKEIAQNPEAFARYMGSVQSTLLDIEHNLTILARETRVHCRGTHVEGDSWYHARLRARPVEQALKRVLTHVNGLTAGLEKASHERHAHEDRVQALPGERRQKQLAKAQKKGAPALQAVPPQTGHGQATPQTSAPAGNPTSIFDLGKGRSA